MNPKKFIIAMAIATVFLAPAITAAKGVVTPKIYAFGFAASFNDTIVHFTEVHPIDSAWIDNKDQFLMGREQYSNMMRDYLSQQGMPHRTCIVVFDKKPERLQKKYLKMKKLYTDVKKGVNHNEVRIINANDFRFHAVDMQPEPAEAEVAKPEETE
jgi:hypothetical protein